MDLNEFTKMWEAKGKSEEGAIKCFLIGIMEFNKKNKDALKMIALTQPKSNLKASGDPGSIAMLGQFKQKPNVAPSYLGGTPANGYKGSYNNDLDVQKNSQRGEKESKLFIKSGGKHSPSPVRLKKNKHGYWKLFELSSLATGVERIEDDDF